MGRSWSGAPNVSTRSSPSDRRLVVISSETFTPLSPCLPTRYAFRERYTAENHGNWSSLTSGPCHALFGGMLAFQASPGLQAAALRARRYLAPGTPLLSTAWLLPLPSCSCTVLLIDHAPVVVDAWLLRLILGTSPRV
jgi:hypothetical protein